MIRVYTAPSLPAVSIVMGLLESEGIHCMLRNENLSSAMGELPPIECWPELWILNAYDEVLARKLVTDFQTKSMRPPGPSWKCRVCGEQIEGNFELCWNCLSDRPIDDDARGIIDQA